MSYHIVLLSIIVLSIFPSKYLQSIELNDNKDEKGFYPVKNISPKDYDALPQNWALIQDKRGIIYVGNKQGVLVFDGTDWRNIETANQSEVRSLAISKEGKVYVGAYNEFGILKPDKNGELKYESITGLIPESEREFGDVWKVFENKDKVYFQTLKTLFVYQKDTVFLWQAKGEFNNSFQVNSDIYLTDKNNGIFKVEKSGLEYIAGSKRNCGNRIYGMLAFQKNIILSVFEKEGAYLWGYEGSSELKYITPLKTEIDDFITNNQVYNAIYINDSSISIATFNGAGVINRAGELKYWINEKTGIIDSKIHYQYLDANSNLWLGLSNGLSHIKISSPINSFNKSNNINGTIESITRHKGTIYIATSVGAMYLVNSIANNQLPQFERISNMKASETWIVESFKIDGNEILLAEKNQDIFEIDHKSKQGRPIFNEVPWAIYQTKGKDNKFAFGLEDGVLLCERKTDGRWIVKERIKGIDKRIIDIIEDNNGNIWFSTESEGIFRCRIKDIELADACEISHYSDSANLPGGPYIFTLYKNVLFVGTSNGIYRYHYLKDEFYLDKEFSKAFGDESRYIHEMSVDNKGRLWIVTYINDEHHELGFFDYDKDSNLFWNPTPFLGNIKGQINAIYHDDDGITWLGGSEGLFRYDSRIEKNYEQDFYCLIRKVKLGEDSTIFYGTYYNDSGFVSSNQPNALKPILKYAYNSLIFNYSAMNIDVDHPTQYSYYLEGFDKKWSEWTEETKKEYTNLPENEYSFKVKAKTVYNHESHIGIYEFEILPPWYRTWWAYILFGFVAIGIVYLIVTQYTKYLRAVIKEKTAEIVEQKDEIEKQNHEITSSIVYAQRIQKAVVPSYDRAQELLPEHFVLWRPRDIVSGDFWWMTEKNGLVAIVAADSTGHGVPGAFVSMLGVSFLNEIVGRMENLKADEILNQLRLHVKTTMKQTGKEGEAKDGMDLALIILDLPNSRIQYAGAYNPLFLIRNGELLETKANRNPIGIYIKEADFTNHVIDVVKGDTLYIFSDGFVDQFGGEKGGKFKTKNFKALLLKIQDKSMLEQELLLDRTVDDWRGELDQVDDIIIVGIRI